MRWLNLRKLFGSKGVAQLIQHFWILLGGERLLERFGEFWELGLEGGGGGDDVAGDCLGGVGIGKKADDAGNSGLCGGGGFDENVDCFHFHIF